MQKIIEDMEKTNLDGLGVALATPFNKDFSIDYESLERLIEHVINGGCDYLVVLGTTGETPTLSDAEKVLVTRFVCEKTAERVPLVLGIGGNCTTKVIEEIQKRDLEGYSAILSVTPYYNKPTQEGLYRHYQAIGESSPLPIILYNVPGRTGVNLTADTTVRLSSLSQKFIGVKEASGNLEQSEKIISNSLSDFKVISGDDALVTALMRRGAVGVISVLANAFPTVMKKLVVLCREGKFSEAEVLQLKLKSIIGHLFEDGNPAGVKAILSIMGLAQNILRLPLVPVNQKIEEKLRNEISEVQA